MRVFLLGSFELYGQHPQPIPLGGRRVGMLLARLALNPSELIPTNTLIEDLWEDEPPAAGGINALHRLVSRARHALRQAGHAEAGVIAGPGGYQLAVAAEAVDVHHFERLTAAGRALLRNNEPEQAVATLRQALTLWRGTPLAEFAGTTFARQATVRLEEIRLTALEARIEADLTLGKGAEVLNELRVLTDEHPLRERSAGLLIRALHASGNPAEALTAYERLRAALAEKLGAVPSAELRRIHTHVLTEAPPVRQEPIVRAGNEPAPPAARLATASGPSPTFSSTSSISSPIGLPIPISRFVGRTDELGRLTALLPACRLITLYGPGGVGKTRLAIEFAARLDSQTAHPVCFVELASLREGRDLAESVAAALGLPDTPLLEQSPLRRGRSGQLTSFLSAHPRLLILDNCEHVIAEVSRFASELLAGCPRLSILVTSREPLMVTGEVLFRVGPLQIPDSPEEGENCATVQLFCDRAGLAQSGFALTADNRAVVADICRKLDGLPLAIELAAARLRSMSLQQVNERLADRFRLLTGGSHAATAHHRTLRATMDWSWELLTAPEQMLARRLSVVGDGITVDTAAAMGAGAAGGDLAEDEVPYTLSSLADKSLLQLRRTGDGDTRYHMLETTRVYCRQRLSEAGEEEATEAAFGRYFLGLAEHAADRLRGADQPRWIARLDADHTNILLALRLAVGARDVDAAVRIGLALSWYWVMRGRYKEADDWCAELLAFGDSLPVGAAAVFTTLRLVLPTPVDEERSQMIVAAARRARDDDAMAGHLLMALLEPKCWQTVGDYEEMERSADRACLHPDAWARACGQAALGFVAESTGDVATGERRLRRALESFRELGDQWSTGQLTCVLSRFSALRGDTSDAVALLHEARAATELVGSAGDIAQIQIRLGVEQLRSGEYDAAEVSLHQALRARQHLPEHEALVAAGLGELATCRRQPGIAREHLSKALRLLDDAMFDKEFLHIEVLRRVAALELTEEENAAARGAADEALRHALSLADMWLLATVAELMAAVVGREGLPHRAARLLGVATALRGGADLGSAEVRDLSGELVARLGETEFRHLVREGECLSQDEAVRELTAGSGT
ncbi:AfsR/SARP family transcriptional regulator [Streptomyces enissocaesilis]|uniref:BTAD domain-containing putative transcriptional regulator n=1 Tax=Streptomyces enissocaesilis TaxID=332589 RepID=A0ABP6JHS6_9ACTN